MSAHRRHERRGSDPREQARAAEILRQPERDARAAGHEREVRARRADGDEMRILDRVDDRMAHAVRAEPFERAADRGGPLAHDRVRHQPDARLRLPLQHAHEVRIGHRRERVILHRRL
jgi:hypothetical protein